MLGDKQVHFCSAFHKEILYTPTHKLYIQNDNNMSQWDLFLYFVPHLAEDT